MRVYFTIRSTFMYTCEIFHGKKFKKKIHYLKPFLQKMETLYLAIFGETASQSFCLTAKMGSS